MTVSSIMRRRGVTGDVGIEIEVEGSHLPDTERHWYKERDGSLRDTPESCEYVLREPMALADAKKALTYLSKQYKGNKTRVNDSPRCGVHVHVNCQQLSIVQLYNFMTLYLIFEDMLVRWCGPTREGNLFCLRAQDAEYLLHMLIQAANEKEFRRMFLTDDLRYASMNVNALPRYGSLEFRAMRGTEDMNLIYQWASMLVGLREAAKQFDNPNEIIMSTSEGGNENFLRTVFSEKDAKEFLAMEDWQELMTNGVQRTQELGFLVDWEDLASLGKRVVGGIQVSHDWDDDFPTMDV